MQGTQSDQNPLRADSIKLERRTYHEDSSPEEISLLSNRVQIYQENILLYKEVYVTSPFTVNLLFDKLEYLIPEDYKPGILIDVSMADNPDAKSRKILNIRFKQIQDKVSHVAFITNKNLIINTAIRFVMYGTDLKSFSVNQDYDRALKNLKKYLK